jgi:hypothetical protein
MLNKFFISLMLMTVLIFTITGCANQFENILMPNTQLIVYNSSSDLVVTADSDVFKDSYDVVDIVNSLVNHRSSAFITSIVCHGSQYVCDIDNKFKYADIVNIDPVGTQNQDTCYSLKNENFNLEIKTSSSNTVSMSYKQRYVNVRHVNSNFQYLFSDSQDNIIHQVAISGNIKKLADVKVLYNDEVYIVSATDDIDNLTIKTTMPNGSIITTQAACLGKRFHILINTNGTAVIS